MAWQQDIAWLGRGAAAGLLIAGATEAASVLVGRNFHELVPGRVYRCAQPGPADIRRAAEDYGIRTVINLRGCAVGVDWYDAECEATADLDLCQEDLTLSAGRLPAPQELRRLLDVLDRADYPVLIHCRRGVDRTGLASAAYLLLHGADLSTALRALSLGHGHVSLGRTVAMKRFFALYQRWLDHTCRGHSAANFRDFIVRGYVPGPARARLELVGAPVVGSDRPTAVVVRAHNDSDGDWHLRPGTGTGVHLKFQVINAAGVQLQEGHAGLFAARVAPNTSIDLTLTVNKLPPAGRYVLTADLLDGPETAFAQLGNEPLIWEFEVR
jgi:protein tyrosine phosphatase (PTP) superfamily phosphohydrolase (DUF442 family)